MQQSILNDKRLLAVDDEPDILETLSEQLEDFQGLILQRPLALTGKKAKRPFGKMFPQGITNLSPSF